MNLAADLLSFTENAASQFDIPPVRRVFIPEPHPDENRRPEFGMIELEDNSAGLYFAWLGDSQKGMNARFANEHFVGRSPLTIAKLYAKNTDAERSLGLAAINAISQSIFRQRGIELPSALDSFGGLTLASNDVLGMVGNFISLIERARTKVERIIVVEKKPHLLGEQGNVLITGDLAYLRDCQKIILTAATLINDTLEQVLEYCQHAAQIIVLGPTAGFLPEVLFQRGIHAVAGSQIIDPEATLVRLRAGKNLLDTARRYVLWRDAYRALDPTDN